MRILLDTNFVISAARKKIDYDAVMNGLTSEDVKWVIPEEVLAELRGLSINRDTRKGDLSAIDLALEILDSLKAEVVKMSGKNVDVDTKIVNYIKDTPLILATLDKGLKKRVKNKILTIRGKNHLEIA